MIACYSVFSAVFDEHKKLFVKRVVCCFNEILRYFFAENLSALYCFFRSVFCHYF